MARVLTLTIAVWTACCADSAIAQTEPPPEVYRVVVAEYAKLIDAAMYGRRDPTNEKSDEANGGDSGASDAYRSGLLFAWHTGIGDAFPSCNPSGIAWCSRARHEFGLATVVYFEDEQQQALADLSRSEYKRGLKDGAALVNDLIDRAERTNEPIAKGSYRREEHPVFPNVEYRALELLHELTMESSPTDWLEKVNSSEPTAAADASEPPSTKTPTMNKAGNAAPIQ